MAKDTKSNFYDEPDDQHDRVSGESEDAGSSAVGTLPKSILMGKSFNVGDEVTLKITAVHDDEVVVEYTSGEKESPKEDETPAEETEEETPESAEVSTDARYD